MVTEVILNNYHHHQIQTEVVPTVVPRCHPTIGEVKTSIEA